MKKTFKKLVFSGLIVLCLFALTFVITGCSCSNTTKPSETTAFNDKGEVGEYISSALADGVSLKLDKNEFTFTTGGTTLKGTYSFDGTNLVLTFEGETDGVNVTMTPTTVSFTYKGQTYTLYRKVNYTVSFSGATVQAQQVQNGQKATKPQDPTKDGYYFLGWYKDSSFTTPFDFDAEIITADTTLYAKFDTKSESNDEFTVTFNTGEGGPTVNSVQTANNTVYSLPTVEVTGKTFLGWWVSYYNDATKLSYQFESGMRLYENTTLFAVFGSDNPAVSVVGNTIKWDSKGVGKSYTITITKEGEEEAIYTKSVSTTSETFNFANEVPGNYTVTVATGSNTGTAYVLNKGLAKVSNFSVDGFTLTWNKVPNATDYALSVNGATATPLGDVNTFDFTNVQMTEDGVTFVVTASANNYLSSVSSAYNVKRSLDKVTTVNYDSQTQKLTWNEVADADKYRVEITSGDDVYKFDVTTNEFAIDGFFGDLSYSVTPLKTGYYSEAKTGTLTKNELATPKNVAIIGNDVKWDAVQGATSYTVTVNGTAYTATTNSYTLAADVISGSNSFTITVKANGASTSSLVSDAVTINKGGVTQITYSNHVISWNSIPGVSSFTVKVDNGEAETVNDNKVTKVITAGAHTISVAPAGGDYFSYQVIVYTLTFNTLGGIEVEDYYYVAGDTIPDFAATYTGYDFTGWYTTQAKAQEGTQKYNEITFTASDLTLYAGWQGKEYTATFNYTDLGVAGDANQTVVFGDQFTLPVVKSNSELKAFYGWYSEPNNGGVRYTDQNGKSRFAWRDAANTTLYAGWIDVFKFALLNDDTYSVTASEGALYLSEVTIPDKYNGKSVSLIESYAFKDYENLTKINIPNSIITIETGNSGPNGTGSAFKGCKNLVGLYIYAVDGVKPEDILYTSANGSLVYKNTTANEVELKWIPYGTVSGVYTIPEGVTSIPINTFQSCTEITGLVIPASVTTINEGAFIGAYQIAEVTFQAAAEGVAEKALNLGDNIFGTNSRLTVLNFPMRVDNFSATTLPSLSALTQVNFVGTFENSKYKSVDGVVYNTAGTTLIYYPRGREETFVIPTGVTTIATRAFEEARYLRGITIPGHVTTIEDYAFRTCSRLDAITFQGTANDPSLSIGDEAFYNAGNFSTVLTELVLPANLQTIGKSAFGNMVAISKVKLYSVAETLNFAPGAFGSNVSSNPVFYITHLFMSKDVHTFNVAGVFGSTKLEVLEVEQGNEYFKVQDGVLYSADMTAILYYPMSFTGAFTLPSTITTIGDRVFEQKKMPSITIPAAVTTIGAYAFTNCPNLASVTFTEGGTAALTIGNYAFSGCKLLTTMDLPDRVSTIGTKVFEGCTGLTTVNIGSGASFATESTSITIGRTRYTFDIITAFDGCTKLTAINVSNSNTNYCSASGVLCEYILDNNNEPTEFVKVDVCPMAKTGALVLPNTVKVIEYNAFYNQNGLTSISFAEGVSSLEIKQYAFRDAKTVTSITLPSVISSIESYTFTGCKALTSFTVPKSVTSIKSSAFTQCVGLTTINFEEGGTQPLRFEDGDYKGRDESYGDSSSSEEEGDQTPISTFAGCNGITSLVFPERTTFVGKSAFGGMMGLTSVSFPSTITSIGDWAFSFCQNLETVTFANNTTGLEKIGQGAFRGRYSYEPTKLASINLPNGTYAIGDGAFKYTSLTNVVVPAGVTEIGKYAFYSDQLLTEVSLPTSLIFIREYAFSNDTALTTVSIANGATLQGVGAYAFKNTGVTSITFPATIYQIGQEAFYNCTDLATVTFALNGSGKSNLAQIGTRAFANTAITSFVFPESVDTEGANINIALGGNVTLVANGGGGSTEELHCPKCGATVTKDDKVCPECRAELHFEEEGLKCPKCGATVKEGQKECPECGMELKFRKGKEEEGGERPGEGGEGGGSQGGGGSSQFVNAPSYLFEGCKKLATLQLSSSVTSIDCMLVNCPALTTVTIAAGNPNLKVDTNNNKVIVNVAGTAIRNVYGKLTGTFTIPAGITEISSYAFAGQTELTKIVIPSSVYEIGEYAFKNCINLTEVEFANGSALAKIDNYLFQDCRSLTTINIPNSVTEIGNYAFAGCASLATLPVTSAVTKVGDYAFANCGFTTLTVPSTITTYGKGVFQYNSKLTTVSIGEGATVTGAYMFANNKALANITLPTSLQFLAEGMFQNCTALVSVSAPNIYRLGGNATTANNTNNLAGRVFEGCTALTNVAFGNDFFAIGSYTFAGCTSLTSFTIPNSVQNLGEHIFDGCTNLVSCTLSNTCTYLAGSMFYNCTSLESITMPASVRRIGGTYTTSDTSNITATSSGNVFNGCTSLSTVTFSENVVNIGYGAFIGCTSLTEVTLPPKLQRISTSAFESSGVEVVTFTQEAALNQLGNYTFRYCENLREVNGFKTNTSNSLGYETFNGCTSLASFKIPTNTSTTGNGTFKNCTSLTELDFSATNIYQLGSSVCEGCVNLSKLLLPATFPQISTNNFTFASKSFMGCTSLEEITLPYLPNGKVFNFSTYAFYGSGLKQLNLPSNVMKYNINNTTTQATGYGIDYAAFNNCPELELTIDPQNNQYMLVDDMFIVRFNDWQQKALIPCDPVIVSVVNASGDVVIPEGLKINNYAFSGCENITSLTIPATMTTIPNQAFSGYLGGNIIIPEGVTTISSQAFYGCANITSITLPSTITSIADYAFQGCSSLTSIVIPEGVTSIGNYLFQGCTSLESITIPESVTSIGNYAFQECTSLTSITFPAGLTSIGNHAFENTGLTSVTIGSGVRVGTFNDGAYSTDGYVFAGCTSLTNVTYNASSISSKHMFDGCTNLTTITFGSPLTQIDGYAFYGCSKLTSFTFNAGLKSIGAYAFSGTGLTTVTLPASLTKLCDGAFMNCTSLTSVTLSSGLKYIGGASITALDQTSNDGGVFEGCTALTTVTLPNTLFAINGRTFAGCTSIASIVIPESVSFVGNGAFAGWTASQNVNSVQDEYTIAGLWEYETTSEGLFAYNADSNATFTFGYTA